MTAHQSVSKSQMKWPLALLSVCLLLLSICTPAQAFVIKDIQVKGNHRVPTATVRNYLPVHEGQTLTDPRSSRIIHDLYATGFFDDVRLSEHGSTLVIHVVERPMINGLIVSGNKKIPKDKIIKALKKLGIAEGEILNRAALRRVKRSIEGQYDQLGYYNVRVKTDVEIDSMNRAIILIDIYEGKVAKIQGIEFIGNHHVSDGKLLDQMKLTTPGLFTWVTSNDEYTKMKLDRDLDNIRNYYLDHGYAKFKIISSTVSITPKHDGVYIVIRLKEGAQYKISGYEFAGKTVLSKAKLRDLVKFEPGQVFSRAKIVLTNQKIVTALGNKGYAYAKVQPRSEFNEKKHTVFLTFFIEPGPLVYVNRIHFLGNTKTEDIVLRSEMRQNEGALINVDNVQESLRRLRNLGYLKDIRIKTSPVPGHRDQVDLSVQIKEEQSAQAYIQGGYGTDGFVYGAGLNQVNFMGTGRSLELAFDDNRYKQSYRVSYVNPYYTLNGVQRSWTLYRNRYTPGDLNLASYGRSDYGVSVRYSIPVGTYSYVNLGAGYNYNKLSIGNTPSQEIRSFVAQNGKSSREVQLSAGWSYSDLDQIIFPTKGVKQAADLDLSLAASRNSLNYYTASYVLHTFYPLDRRHKFIATSQAGLGYGDGLGNTGNLPFYQNFYAGGPGSVRGYETNSLGPKDSNDKPFGGNAMLRAGLGLIFPNGISDNMRTSIFVDAGNVYNTRQESVRLGGLRTAAGIEVDYRVAMLGVISFSVAKALNAKRGDDTEVFQFMVGANL